MSKALTFSRTFPAYHPKAGQPTYFVEKFWRACDYMRGENILKQELRNMYAGVDGGHPKYHTIRAGHRFKVGDKFSPRVWSGRPYNSKQIIIASDMEVLRMWDFKSTGNNHLYINEKSVNVFDVEILAKNDGLTYADLLAWLRYPAPFDGQIICWNKDIIY